MLAAYHVECVDCGRTYETDHLIRLSLGGSNDAANLWPQPEDDAKVEDRVEHWLHARVCRGDLSLTEAQEPIAADWLALADEMRPPRSVRHRH